MMVTRSIKSLKDLHGEIKPDKDGVTHRYSVYTSTWLGKLHKPAHNSLSILPLEVNACPYILQKDEVRRTPTKSNIHAHRTHYIVSCSSTEACSSICIMYHRHTTGIMCTDSSFKQVNNVSLIPLNFVNFRNCERVHLENRQFLAIAKTAYCLSGRHYTSLIV